MENKPVVAKIENGCLILSIPITNGTVSKSGKSILVASTGGFQKVDGTQYSISYNITRPLGS